MALSLWLALACALAACETSPTSPSAGPRAVGTASPPSTAASLYFVAQGGLFALRAGDGRVRWRVSRPNFMPTPAYAAGTLYLGAQAVQSFASGQVEPATLVAVRAGDGGVEWERALNAGDSVASAPIVFGDEVLVAASAAGDARRGSVYAVRAADGHQVWRTALDTVAPDTLVVATSAGEVVFAAPLEAHGSAYEVAALRVSDGSLLWKRDFPAWATFAAPTGDGVLYVGAGDRLCALGLADGHELWSRATSAAVRGAPVVEAGVVFAPLDVSTTGAGGVIAVDARDGAARWQATVPAEVTAPLVLADGQLYAVTSDHALTALRARDGTTLWRASTGDAIPRTPVTVHDGLVYLPWEHKQNPQSPTTGETALYALRAADGVIRARYHTDGMAGVVLPEPDGIYASAKRCGFSPCGAGSGYVYRFTPGQEAPAWSYDVPAAVTVAPELILAP